MSDTGPRSFDHTEMAGLPEYHAARQALDALARRLDHLRGDGEHVEAVDSRAGWIEAVANMARTGYAADLCRSCRETICYPYAAKVEAGMLRGRYRCLRCRCDWGCSYTTALELLPRP
jgi:hypothetical protein